MDGEGLVVGVPDGQRLEPTDVGAVAEFGLSGGQREGAHQTRAESYLSITPDVLVCSCWLEELLVLLGIALITQGDQVHALVQAVWAGLADQLVGHHLVLLGPVVLLVDLPQPLSAGQSRLEAIDAAGEVVLALVKDLLVLEQVEDGMFAGQTLLGKEELAELVNVDVGFAALLGKQLGTLGSSGLEVLHPLGDGGDHSCGTRDGCW